MAAGGLAIRSCDTDEPQFLRRVIIYMVGNNAHLGSQPWDRQIWRFPYRIPYKAFRFPQYRIGSRSDRLVNEISAIAPFSGISQKRIALLHLAAIGGKTADFDAQILKNTKIKMHR